MSDLEETLPPATPETQAEPAARAGGTNAQNDFSRSAQRSRSREGVLYKNRPFEDPSRDESAPAMGEAEDRERGGAG